MRTAPFRSAALLLAAMTALGGVQWDASAREAPKRVRDAVDAIPAELPAPGTMPFLGVVTTPAAKGLEVARVIRGSASELAGLRTGDVLRDLEGVALRTSADLDRALDAQTPGDRIRLSLERDDALIDMRIVVGGRRQRETLFRGGAFRLAVVPVLFWGDAVDAVANESQLTRFFFSETGRTGPGASLTDYYVAQSLGSFRVEGRVLRPVRLAHPRGRYVGRPMGAGSGSLFSEAASLLADREGRDGLRDIDGIVFLHTGASSERPGRALWPHRAVVRIGGRRMPYYVHSGLSVAAGEIGEHCHEFAHLLGLNDEYGVGHRTGSGDFCVMGIGHRGGGEAGAQAPFSLCAPCRVRMGWLPTVVVDPRVPQRLRLSPVHRRGAHAVVVPLDERTREYLLLEVRGREGFDRDLPSAGMLVWRIGGSPTPGQGIYGNEVDLLESHGIDSFESAMVRTSEIAFPTRRAADLTPHTMPGVRVSDSRFAPYLTDMERSTGGHVTVTIGVRERVQQIPPRPLPFEATGRDGTVERTDPITGERVQFVVGRRPDTSPEAGRDSR